MLVATVRSLKMQGGADKKSLTKEDLGALEKGLPHLEHHLKNVRQFGVPVVIAINRFLTRHATRSCKMVHDYAAGLGARVVLARCGRRVGRAARIWRGRCWRCSTRRAAKYTPLYDAAKPDQARRSRRS